MILYLQDIPDEGLVIDEQEPASILELEDAFDIRLCGPIDVSVRAVLVGDELVVRGRLGIRVEFLCARCAEFFPAEVSVPDFLCARDVRAEETPRRRHGGPSGKRPAKVASVDLTQDIREAILLAFPTHWVCDPDCRGLCPQCGINRNKASCDCRPPPDIRWAGLAELDVTKGTTHGRTEKESIEK